MKNTLILILYIYLVLNKFVISSAYAQQPGESDHYQKYQCCRYLEKDYIPGRCRVLELTNAICKTINEISDQYVAETRKKLLSDLSDAKQKWELTKTDKYEINLGYQTAWYQEEATIRVNEGAGELMHLVCPAKEPEKSCVLLNKTSTSITSLFDDVKSQIDKLTYNGSLKVVYDDKYGYPKSITTDRKDIYDGWVSYRINQFKILDSNPGKTKSGIR